MQGGRNTILSLVALMLSFLHSFAVLVLVLVCDMFAIPVQSVGSNGLCVFAHVCAFGFFVHVLACA